jgi:hypothetical protein
MSGISNRAGGGIALKTVMVEHFTKIRVIVITLKQAN